ncbi:FAD:protein FMN transferase [Sphingomonas sp. PP-CE-1G-424]|uniref:FAD:protein FMN transferase n=1 Tax=Sphingomonas sp. PP-CE-1G-424 TaxID=2135658 RepID=UPI0010F2DAE0|nr:FAD:protein FMN transferase [Sphingomonas sp. PP-CE-1G-424]TCP72302.1 thiamine biosynthesis lipoprotein [Sphingomonas sp. PP-CE-1G-424]
MRIALPPTIDAAAFAARDPSAVVLDLHGETMGTSWSVRFAAPAGTDPSSIRAAIVARLAGLVAEMSHWAPNSMLSRFNRSAPGTWTTLPPDFAHVMTRGLAIAELTNGAFDPAIGRLVDAWGFGPVPVARLASAPEIETARATSGWSRLSFAATGAHLRQPGGTSLDLSGIAKGHAVDVIADLLHDAGIANALVEIGGELVGRGIKPDGDPWWVDLESPPGLTLPPLRIALHGQAVATSGDYRRGAHTLDPRTGRPIETLVVSASVVHQTALDADAWATALTVLGPDGLDLAHNQGIAARLVTEIDGTVREYFTPGLSAMLSD